MSAQAINQKEGVHFGGRPLLVLDHLSYVMRVGMSGPQGRNSSLTVERVVPELPADANANPNKGDAVGHGIDPNEVTHAVT